MNATAKATAILRTQRTATLLEALDTLAAKEDRDENERAAFAYLVDELGARYPEALDAADVWQGSLDLDDPLAWDDAAWLAKFREHLPA